MRKLVNGDVATPIEIGQRSKSDKKTIMLQHTLELVTESGKVWA